MTRALNSLNGQCVRHSINVQPDAAIVPAVMRKLQNVKKTLTLALGAAALATACTPTVRLEAPREPITINLNVKIDQEVRVKLDREVEDLIATNPDLF